MLSSRGWRVTCALGLCACSVARGLESQEHRDAERVRALAEKLGNAGPRGRRRAARALGRMGPAAEAAAPALVRALKDKDSYVRKNVASVFRGLGSAAVPALLQALEDADPGVRASAASILGEMGPAAEEGVPALIKALEDKELDVRRSAAIALGTIGPAAEAAVPALSRAMKDEHSGVRAKAESALREIAPEAPALLRLDRSRRRTERAQARMRWLIREVWKMRETEFDLVPDYVVLGILIWLIFLLLGALALVYLAIATFRRFTRVRKMWVFCWNGSVLAALQYVVMIVLTWSIKGAATPWVIISAVPYLTAVELWFLGLPSLGIAVTTAAVPVCAARLYYLARHLRPKDI